MNRELISTKGQLSAARKEGIEAFNELKDTDNLMSKSLKAELDRLREDCSLVVGERDAQKSQLIEALLAKEKLRKEIEEGRELHDTSAVDPTNVDVSEAAKKSGEKIEKLRARLKERKQVSEKRQGCILPGLRGLILPLYSAAPTFSRNLSSCPGALASGKLLAHCPSPFSFPTVRETILQKLLHEVHNRHVRRVYIPRLYERRRRWP